MCAFMNMSLLHIRFEKSEQSKETVPFAGLVTQDNCRRET